MSDILNSSTDSIYFSLSSSSEGLLSADSDSSDMPDLGYRLHTTFSSVPKNFNVVHINAQSINKHYPDLLATFTTRHIHAICISESHLLPALPSTLYPLSGYRLFRRDRTHTTGGGVAVYLRADLDCKVVLESDPGNNTEYLFLEISLRHTKLLLGVFYSPSCHVNYFDSLETILDSLRSQYEQFILTGDFNTCLIKNDHRTRSLQSIIDAFNLHILPSGPTHFQPGCTPSLLDLMITSSTTSVVFHGHFNASGFSHHDLVFLSYDLRPPKFKHKTLLLRNFGGMDVRALRADVSQTNWSFTSDSSSVDYKVEKFNATILALYDKHAPLKITRVKHLPAPWLNSEIRALMAQRDRARVRCRQDPSSHNIERFKLLRNRCNSACRHARRQYIFESIEQCPPHNLWKFLKTLGVGKPKFGPLSNIDLNALNVHFSSPPCTLSDTSKSKTLDALGKTSNSSVYQPFQFREVTVGDVRKILCSISTRAMGEDGLSKDMFTPITDEITPVITNIVNCSLSSGSFPSAWKKAHIIPLPKNPNPSSFSEYRPISILPVLSKILEHIVQEQLAEFLSRNHLLSPYQSGFRPGHSTVTALVNVTEDLRRNIERRNLTVLTLLDFSNAFNSVDFDILVGALKSLSVSPTVVSWFDSYLRGRQQLVKVDSSKSDWCNLTAGVPQGGVLSPLLFSIFINSITASLSSSFHLYADDLQLYETAPLDEINRAVDVINCDLETIKNWTKRFGLQVNPKKSQAIIIGSSYYISRLDMSTVQDVVFDTELVPYYKTVKNLGLWMDQTLSWIPHTNEVSRKVFGSYYSLKRLQYFLPLETKITLATALLLPLLDYADAAYLDLTEALLDKLERLQNLCIRFIFGLRKYDHVSEFRCQLRWLPIRLRRNCHILSLLYNILNNPCYPDYLRRRFVLRTDCSDRTLRSCHHLDLTFPAHTTRSFANSFSVEAVRLWNELPQTLRNCPSISSFKYNLKKYYLSSLSN